MLVPELAEAAVLPVAVVVGGSACGGALAEADQVQQPQLSHWFFFDRFRCRRLRRCRSA